MPLHIVGRQNGYFTDTFEHIFVTENLCILIQCNFIEFQRVPLTIYQQWLR